MILFYPLTRIIFIVLKKWIFFVYKIFFVYRSSLNMSDQNCRRF